jgi:hypothetical protein
MCGRDVLSDELPLAFWLDGTWKTDKGSFIDGKFTPVEGTEVDEQYIKTVKAIISNKITFAKAVANRNYFNYITPELENMGIIDP